MRNRKRLFMISLAFLFVAFCVPPLAFSSPGRLSGLGLTTGTSWMLDADEGYFFIDPSIIEKLRAQVWGDLTSTSAGLLVNLGKIDLYAVTGTPIAFSFTGIPGTPINPLTEELMRLGVGFAAGNLDLGLSTFAGYTSYANATPDSHQNLVVGLNAGVLLPVSSSMSLDAAAAVTYWSIQRHFTPANDYIATPIDFSARARLSWTIGQNNLLHVFGQYALMNRNYTMAGTATTRSIGDLTAGLSDQMAISDAVMVFAGGYLNGNFTTTAADEVDIYTINAVAGGEFDVTKELAARIGIQKTLFTSTYTRSSGVTTSSNGTTSLTAGLGLTLGDLAVDAQVNVPMLTVGPNFISGFAAPWTMDLSATYYMGKPRA